MTEKEEKITAEKEKKYSKAVLIKSEKYIKHVDVLNVLLEDNKCYSEKEVNSIINGFLKSKG